jgi:hypothetical protein
MTLSSRGNPEDIDAAGPGSEVTKAGIWGWRCPQDLRPRTDLVHRCTRPGQRAVIHPTGTGLDRLHVPACIVETCIRLNGRGASTSFHNAANSRIMTCRVASFGWRMTMRRFCLSVTTTALCVTCVPRGDDHRPPSRREPKGTVRVGTSSKHVLRVRLACLTWPFTS